MGVEEYIKKIQSLEKGVLQSKKNANNIVKLMKLLEVKGEAIVYLVIKSLQRIFTHFVNNKEFTKTYDPSVVATMYKEGRKSHDGEGSEPSKKRVKVDEESKKESAEQVFSKWIMKLYDRYIDKLLEMLWSEQGGIQSNSLNCLLHFVKLESRMQSTFVSLDQPALQPHLFQRVLTQIITSPDSTDFLLSTFCDSKLKIFHDIQYITYWILAYSTLLSKDSQDVYPHERVIRRILNCKKKSTKYWINTPDSDEEGKEGEEDEEGDMDGLGDDELLGDDILGLGDEELGLDLGEDKESKEREKKKAKEQKKDKKELKKLAAKFCGLDFNSQKSEGPMRKVYTKTWVKFVALELSTEMLKQVLQNIGAILPTLSNTFLMMDFLQKCYERGGVFSILALNGIFIQITKFNLDFPHFYKRLYSLFDSGVLHTKYRGNFFSLASRFMFSKYLPSYTAAAFVKRVMRIALAAPPSGSILALAFAHNVMQLHPATQVLLHRTPLTTENGKAPVLLIQTAIGSDPFDAENANPAKSSAINSSLWELLPFMNHQSPTVAKMAQAFRGPLDQPAYDFNELSTASYGTMFAAELKETNGGNPVNFVPKKALFDANLAGWVLPK